MRIVHVATLISPHGEYGGPVRVACRQVEELRHRGHQAILTGSHKGFQAATAPQEFDGAPVRLFRAYNPLPTLGFATTIAPGLFAWFLRNRKNFDVVHIHLARDLVTLPIAWLCAMFRIPYVLQTHGMIVPSPRLLARILDAIAVKRVLHSAKAILHLRPVEADEIEAVAGRSLPTVQVPNGLPTPPSAPAPQPEHPAVLFLARLHPRKQPMAFVEAARQLHAHHPEVDFTLLGPDEGEGDHVTQAIATTPLSGRLQWNGPVEPTSVTEAISKCSVFVLPSRNEPFPMSVLEAMACGRPVVINHDCGLAPLVQEYGAGIVCDRSGPELAEAVDQLLKDADRRDRMGRAGQRLIREELSIRRVGDVLDQIYSKGVGDSTPRGTASDKGKPPACES